jgi:hypothetical protein
MSLRRFAARLRQSYHLALATVLLPALAPSAYAQTQDSTSAAYTAGTSDSGGAMADQTALQLNNITELIWGPGMYLIMAIGAVVAVYGFLKGSKEALWTGVGTFIFAALLRALVPIFLN